VFQKKQTAGFAEQVPPYSSSRTLLENVHYFQSFQAGIVENTDYHLFFHLQFQNPFLKGLLFPFATFV
jgi:hypothetical protein